MMQPQSTLFRGPNEHVGPLKKDQCALTPKTCPLRKALRWGEGAGRVRRKAKANSRGRCWHCVRPAVYVPAHGREMRRKRAATTTLPGGPRMTGNRWFLGAI